MNLPGNFSEVSGRAWREAAGEPRWSAARRDGKRAEEQSCSPWLVWSLCPLNGGLSAAPTTSGLQFQTGDGSGRQRGRGHSSHGPDGARTGGLRCLSAESCARLLLHALHWGSHQCPFPSLSCLFACTLAVTGRSGDCTWAVPSPGPDTMPSATSRPHPELLPCFLRCTCRLCTCRGQAAQSGLSAHHLGCAGWRFQSAGDGRFRPDTARARQPCHSETNARHWLPSCHSLVLHQNCLSDLPT